MSERSQLVFEEESNITETGSIAVCRKRCPKILLIFIALYVVALALFLTVAVFMRKQSARPHVIIMLVDDLGWNDVEWNDAQMRTPTLNALMADGVLLNNSYAHPLDGPSRAAFLTGMYPFHMGLQHENMSPYTPAFLPDNVTLLPAHLQRLGYKTHMLGKWHLGFCDWKYTPSARGFDSFAGFYTDDLDYYTHRDNMGNYDFRSGETPDYAAEGTHTTQLLTDRAKHLIFNHDVSVPFFMLVAFQAVHFPAQVPEIYVNETCGHLENSTRQNLCALTAMMDEGIGNVIAMLRDKGMFTKSVIIVTSDNGGVMSQGSSNGPFRGEHGDLYEGGTRVLTLISGAGQLAGQGQSYTGLFHQVDWIPTILSLAGAPLDWVKGIDGLNHWHAIRTDSTSPRNELVYNIDDAYNNAALRAENFKLIEGPPTYSQRHSSPHHHPTQLYDLHSDPAESNNLADSMPKKVQYLQERLQKMRKTLVPSVEKKPDAKADPALWNGIWSPGWC